MNPKGVAVGMVLLGFLWIYLAMKSFGIGKDLIGFVQCLAALACMGRGVFEWRKAAAPPPSRSTARSRQSTR